LSWSPDGRFLVYTEIDPRTKSDIWVLPLEGERKPFPFLKTEFNEVGARLSPAADSQGRLWMAYASDETGRLELYLRSFLPSAPERPAGVKLRVSSKGGSFARWRKDGRELFFEDAGGKLVAVNISLDGAAEIAAERYLFDMPQGNTGYVPFADGRRFAEFAHLNWPTSIV
jgi:Tol biopolymer transport system component